VDRLAKGADVPSPLYYTDEDFSAFLSPLATLAPAERREGGVPRSRSRRTRAFRVALVFSIVALAVAVPVTAAFLDRFPRPEDVRREPTPTSNRVLLREGQVGTLRWKLTTYESDRGICLELDLFGSANARGGGCGLRLPRVDDVEPQLTTVLDSVFVYGLAGDNVSEVTVLGSGHAQTSPTRRLGTGLRFFIAPIRFDPEVVVAVARDGRSLNTRDIP
jgi:hypothetical protein